MNKIEINGKKIGVDHNPYFIADIAANHDGSLERAIDLIWLAAESGADAAKFQNFTAKTLVSDRGFNSLNKVKTHQSKWKASVYEMYDKASVPLNWTETLLKTCKDAGIDYFTSIYDLSQIEYLNKYVCAWKIGSGDLTWHEMISNCARTKKPILIATGASNLREVEMAVEEIEKHVKHYVLMQCNTNYTGSIENFKHISLNVLTTFKSQFTNSILGLSDHTPGHSTVLGAIALGASVIEKHFTDDSSREGSDHPFSMEPKSWKEMVDRSLELKNALGNNIKEVMQNEIETRIVQRRAIRSSKNLKAGHCVSNSDLVFLRPCPKDGLPPYEKKKIVGKILNKNIDKGDIIKLSDLEGNCD